MSFAIEIYRRAAAAGGNVVFSPYSIAVALRMLLAGARGETAAEMARLVPEVAPAADFVSANALWVDHGYPLRPEYARALSRGFDASLEAVDFSRRSEAAARINAWVSEVTRGKIANLVSPSALDALTRLVLTNAVYLKAKWRMPFADTRDEVFHAGPGRDVTVPMMALRGVRLNATRIGGGRVFELPYRGPLHMLVLLPDTVDGLAELETSLDPRTWTLTPRNASVFLPRFSATTQLELGPVLRAMGVRRVFDPSAADLSGISAEPGLSVSAAVHQARIDVDEEGTEAAAATAFAVAGAAMRAERPELFRVDRPFLFLIRTAGGEIVFIGRMLDPIR